MGSRTPFKNKTTDIINRTIQAVKEMLASMRSVPEEPRQQVQFDLHFEEVDFAIAPKILKLCNELSSKLRAESADTIYSGYVTALSCQSFEQLSKGERKCKDDSEYYETSDEMLDMEKPSTFIVIPSRGLQEEPITNDEVPPGCTGYLIVQTDQTRSVLILKSEQEGNKENEISEQNAGQSKSKTDISTSVLTEEANARSKSKDEDPPQSPIKAYRIFTIDTLPNCKVVCSKSNLRQVGEYVPPFKGKTNEKTTEPVKRAEDKEIGPLRESVEPSKDSAKLPETSKNNFKEHIKENEIVRREQASSIDIIDLTQDVRTNNVCLAVRRIETPTSPAQLLEAKKIEMVTLDPLFSSITQYDKVGSMQITQRPMSTRYLCSPEHSSERSKQKRSPEKNSPRNRIVTNVNTDTTERPKRQFLPTKRARTAKSSRSTAGRSMRTITREIANRATSTPKPTNPVKEYTCKAVPNQNPKSPNSVKEPHNEIPEGASSTSNVTFVTLPSQKANTAESTIYETSIGERASSPPINCQVINRVEHGTQSPIRYRHPKSKTHTRPKFKKQKSNTQLYVPPVDTRNTHLAHMMERASHVKQIIKERSSRKLANISYEGNTEESATITNESVKDTQINSPSRKAGSNCADLYRRVRSKTKKKRMRDMNTFQSATPLLARIEPRVKNNGMKKSTT